MAWPYPACSWVARMKAGSVDSLFCCRSVRVLVRKGMRESTFSSCDGLGGIGTWLIRASWVRKAQNAKECWLKLPERGSNGRELGFVSFRMVRWCS